MSRPKFLADHNLAASIVKGTLRAEPTIAFLTAREVGAERMPDPELLQLASDRGLIVVSHDRNTLLGFAYDRIRARISMAGLIIVDQSEAPGLAADDLVFVWAASEAEEWEGRVEFLPFR